MIFAKRGSTISVKEINREFNCNFTQSECDRFASRLLAAGRNSDFARLKSGRFLRIHFIRDEIAKFELAQEALADLDTFYQIKLKQETENR